MLCTASVRLAACGDPVQSSSLTLCALSLCLHLAMQKQWAMSPHYPPKSVASNSPCYSETVGDVTALPFKVSSLQLTLLAFPKVCHVSLEVSRAKNGIEYLDRPLLAELKLPLSYQIHPLFPTCLPLLILLSTLARCIAA